MKACLCDREIHIPLIGLMHEQVNCLEQRNVTRSEISYSIKNSEPVYAILLLIHENCDAKNCVPPRRALIENDMLYYNSTAVTQYACVIYAGKDRPSFIVRPWHIGLFAIVV